MGSWDETCALTGLAVGYGDPVVMAVIDRTAKLERLIHGSVTAYGRTPVFGVYENVYDDYGWVKDVEQAEEMGERPDFRSVFFHKKAWDAAVVDFDDPKVNEHHNKDFAALLRMIFECDLYLAPFETSPIRAAAKEIIRDMLPGELSGTRLIARTEDPLFGFKLLEDGQKDEFIRRMPKLFVDYVKIMVLCQYARINLFAGLSFKGSQADNPRLRLHMNSIARAVVADQRRKLREWDREN